ncbi:MAG: hypothetical protein FJ006_11840 [Chloroflexi bacterium]|nr:hypothetical protein [Chloroflexota bacterium]
MSAARVKCKDIRLSPDEEKEETYKLIDGLVELGIPVTVKEHRSGFPAVTVDCGEVHILTDILSLEAWSAKKKKTG